MQGHLCTERDSAGEVDATVATGTQALWVARTCWRGWLPCGLCGPSALCLVTGGLSGSLSGLKARTSSSLAAPPPGISHTWAHFSVKVHLLGGGVLSRLDGKSRLDRE